MSDAVLTCYNNYFVFLIVNLQTKLVNVAESISNKLSYFTELERVGSRLNSSTLSVTSDSFVATLARLDECISFIEKNVSLDSTRVVRFIANDTGHPLLHCLLT